MRVEELVKGKNVLFITTHRIDYIRNTQEIDLLNKYAKSVTELYGNKGNHILSAIKILFVLFFTSLDKYDIIFVSYMSQLIVPLANRRLRNKVLIVDFFISLYDSLVFDRQKLSQDSLGARLAHRLDRDSLKNADLVIADTKAHAAYFADEFAYKLSDIEVLYLEADKTIYYPMEVEKPGSLKDKYVVLYFGSVIPLQGIETVLEAVNRLRDNKSIYFVIIGPISKLYSKVESDNVSYIDWLSQDELARKIAMADLCLAGHFNSKIDKANRTIPGKVYIYEAMSKCMILGDSIANHELFQEDERHVFVERGDSIALAKAILDFSKNYA